MIQFFDKDENQLLKAGFEINLCNKTHEILLEEGERIVGYKLRKS